MVLFVAIEVQCALGGISIEELRNDSTLTPEKFATHFSKFEFRFAARVQSPEEFLLRGVGDCDDYATLAAELLRSRGYTPRLVAVRMPKMVHVICYIEESGRYLDYNRRGAEEKLARTDGTLEDMAERVSQEFRSRWTSVSEFTYESGKKRLIRTVLAGDRLREKRDDSGMGIARISR